MSCYEWMEGALKMRTSDVNKLQQLLLANEVQSREHIVKIVNAAIEKVLTAFKGKRAVKWRQELDDLLFQAASKEEDFFYERVETLLNDFKTVFPAGEDKRPVLLKASSLPKLNTKKVRFDLGDYGTISLIKKEGLVYVCVNESNHAVDNATATKNWNILYKFCNELDWPRGGGGELAGNDEYNREGRASGGGANYTRYSWKYKSPAEKAKELEARRKASYGYGYGRRL